MNRNLTQTTLGGAHRSLRPYLIVLAALAAFAAVPATQGQTTWYVDNDAPLGGNGASWTTAFKYLQDALALAEADDEIRVAAGVYKPDQDEGGNVTPGDRWASFELVSGVGHYGGYAGLGAEDPDQRDVAQFETILSGDLDGDDGPDFANYDENSLHVTFGDYLESGTLIDGFVFMEGNANGSHHGGYSGGGMRLLGGYPTITNCVLRDNLAEAGGAVYCGASATFRRSVFVGNRASVAGGGAIVVETGWLTATACLFDRNEAFGQYVSHGGGAIWALASTLNTTNCTFTGNSAASLGGAVHTLWSPTTLVNCAVTGNVAPNAGGVSFWGSACSATNCSVFGNTASDSCGGLRGHRAEVAVSNCILWGNTDAAGAGSGAQIAKTEDYGTITVSYCCIQNYTGTYGDLGTITDDPLFVDADGVDDTLGTPDDDLRLAPGSPCIDAADNDALPWDLDDLDGDGVFLERLPFDLAGNPRFLDDPDTPDTGAGTPPIVDMGAFELLVPGLVTSIQTLTVPEGGTATFTVSLATAPEEPVTVTVTPIAGDPDITVQSGASLEFDSGNFDLPQPVTLAAAPDEDSVNGETTIEVAAPGFVPVNVIASEVDAEAEAVVLLVNAAAAPGGDGTSWNTAFDDLQDALDASDAIGSNAQIWVAAGTYTPNRGTGDREDSFELRDNVALFGGFAGNETDLDQRDPLANPTVLSGSQYFYHVVTAIGVGNTAVLDGFTIRAGQAQGPFMDHCGGGMFISTGSPVIRNCTFADNEATSGGAVYNEFFGDPLLVACTFVQNTADSFGGAMYSGFARATLVDCAFVGNLADDGGAVRCTEGECWLTNCRFLGNTATNEGGAVNAVRCETYMMNCVFSGNDGAGTTRLDSGWASLVNCDFSQNYDRGVVLDGESDVGVYNCVLWGNSHGGNTDEDAQIRVVDEDVELDIRYSCVQGWTGLLGGIGNHGDDPLFVDADGEDDVAGTLDDDLHLAAGSPCIDVGSNWLVLPDYVDLDGDGDMDEPTPFDLDGEDRFVDDPNTPDGGGGVLAIVDMGAYEFGDTGWGYCLGDLTGDGQSDFDDLVVLLGHYGIAEGAQPCEGDIENDGDVDLADLAWLLGEYGETCD